MSSNMYLKFEQPEVAGGSADPGHQGEIDVLSWSHGFTQPTGQPETSHSRLSSAKYLDVATNTCSSFPGAGGRSARQTITCFRADGASGNQPVMYLTIVMERVVIANYSISGGPGDSPVENIGHPQSQDWHHYLKIPSPSPHCTITTAARNEPTMSTTLTAHRPSPSTMVLKPVTVALSP
jgi:type VI secretion system secreted protein Hcp